MFFQRLGVFPNDVVQSQVQLVEGERLLELGRDFAGGVVVGVFVIHLQTGEHRVFEADVDADDVVDKCRRLVSLKRRRNGQTGLFKKKKKTITQECKNKAKNNAIQIQKESYILRAAARHVRFNLRFSALYIKAKWDLERPVNY